MMPSECTGHVRLVSTVVMVLTTFSSSWDDCNKKLDRIGIVVLTPSATMQLLAKEGVMLYFAITILGIF